MEITDIRVRRVDTQGKLKAYVTVTFDHCFVVHNVKVIEGNDRVFIAMPSRKTRSGEFKDVAHPISSEFRNSLQEQIVAAYESDTGPIHRVGSESSTREDGDHEAAGEHGSRTGPSGPDSTPPGADLGHTGGARGSVHPGDDLVV